LADESDCSFLALFYASGIDEREPDVLWK